MVPIKKKLCNRTNYGGQRNLKDIKGIVIHYTGNDGDSDEGNGNFFANTANRGASAHYFVDNDSITSSVPDNYIAWHCGTKNKYYHSFLRNSNTIGVEICDEVKDGKIQFSDTTINNAVDLVKMLMKTYNVPIENVVRHYDITHKCCPAPMVNDESKWRAFKKLLTNDYAIKEIKFNLFGTLTNVEAINIDGNNYIKLRSLECDKLKVEYTNGKITINGIKFEPLDTILINGCNYVKLRNLEALNFKILYDPKTGIAGINK